MSGAPRLTDEQEAAVARRDGPLLVSANAGSGKTSVLVERFVRSVHEDGLRPEQILAITFTDKAAGELRARVRARFVELGDRDAARDLEGAWLTTFHGFCARVLRSHAVAAGVDPTFTVLDEAEARSARREAFDAALAGFLGDPGHPRADALDLVAAYTPDRLCRMVQSVHDELRSRGQTRPALPPARPADLAALRAGLAAAREAAAEELVGAADGVRVAQAREALEACRGLLAALGEGGHPRTPAELDGLVVGAGAAALRGPGCERYRAALAAYRAGLGDRDAARAVPLLDELLGLYSDAYAAAKAARAALDFDDLELRVRDLFVAAPGVAAGYRERYARVMVDEFQDTNPLQLELLAHVEGDSAFWVGDELQSIYGFRHADVGLFRARRAQLEPAGATGTLARNFRARPEILAALNAAFGPLHGRWVDLVPGRVADGPGGGAPRVELLITDADAFNGAYERERPELAARLRAGLPDAQLSRQAEARLVAQRVGELVHGEGVAASEVVVLLRATTEIGLYERALELAGLTTLASGGRGWWARQQVQDLCAYLGALANPRDDAALLGAIASPLGGASSDALALLAMTARAVGRTPWEVLADAFCDGGADAAGLRARLAADDRGRLGAFCARFAAERRLAPRLALDELLARVVRDTGYDAHVLGLPGGARRLANVHKLMRLAADFESRRGRDVRGFIDLATAELEADAREPDAPVELGGLDAVRLMSIHAAKGLEFGHVVLADLGRRRNEDHPDLLVDESRIGLRVVGMDGQSTPALDHEELQRERRAREAEEEQRVMHVAMTRAKERLILAGAVRMGESWPAAGALAPPISWIGPALVPGVAGLTEAEPVADHALERAGWSSSVRTMLSTPATVGRVLRLPDPGPGRQLSLLDGGAPPAPPPAPVGAGMPAAGDGAPVPAALSYSALARHAECGYRFYLERILRLPAQAPPPSLLAGEAPGEGIDLLLRGTLVHELLEAMDLSRDAPTPGPDAVREAGRRHEVELDEAAVADQLALLDGFARSPLRARLLAARSLRREHGFAFLLDPAQEAGPLLTGVVDVLAFEADGAALVVDYKSDAVEGADLDALVERAYGVQRRIYALAALRAGAPAVEVAHLFLSRPAEPVARRFEAADEPTLQHELRERAAGVLAGEYPVSERPHRGLCATCPGRNGLCRWGTEMTDRELAA